MNGKHYIGSNAVSFQSTGKTQTIDGVVLVVDEGTEYRAGDQSGYVLELECPYGTQAMADALMEKMRGQSYEGFETAGAKLPMEAELGDGVTVKGMYGPLVRRRVQFVGDLASDISAPVGGDTDHEFGYTDPTQRAIERKAAQTRSYIDKQADAIKIGVEEDLGGQISEIDVKVGEITSTVEKQGEAVSTLTQTADGLTASVGTLSATVDNVSGQLSLKVGRDENDQIVSMLNASADVINIKGNRLTIDSDKFKVAEDGTVTANNAVITSSSGEGTLTLGDGQVISTVPYFSSSPGSGGTYSAILGDGQVICKDDNKEDVYSYVGIHGLGATNGEKASSLDASELRVETVYADHVWGTFNLLWSNYSPGSTFSNRSLTIPGLSEYDMIAVVQNYSTSSPGYTATGFFFRDFSSNSSLAVNCGTYSTSSSGNGHVSSLRVYRFGTTSSDVVTVSPGRVLNNNGVTEDDQFGIPVAIYGGHINYALSYS